MGSRLRVGLVATGSAGQQHAIVMSKLPGVTVVAGADPKNGRELFDKSRGDQWYIPGSNWYADETEMLAKEEIDAIVVSADPLSIAATVKSSALSGFPARPTLWERPVGFRPEHTLPVLEIQRGAPFSVVTFNRFGLPDMVKKGLQSGSIQIGDVVSFNAFLSLSIPEYCRKPWRWDQLSCQLPIHLLDHVFDLLMFLGLPPVESVRAEMKTEFLGGRSIDRSWSIGIKLNNGAVGAISAVQYPLEREHLMPLHSFQIVGSSGAIELRADIARYIAANGQETRFQFPHEDPSLEPLRPAHDALVRYLIEREGYVDTAATRLGAWSLTLCDWHWIQYASADAKGRFESDPLGTIEDSSNCLKIGNAIVESSKRGAAVRV